MTLCIVFRRAAKSEFEDAAVRYDEQRPGLGEEFAIEIEQAIARAAAAPEHYPIVFTDQPISSVPPAAPNAPDAR